jgi:glutaredoxin 3
VNTIEVYSSATCPYCVLAKQLLERKNLSFEEIRVDLCPEKKEEMLSRANGQRTVPQIFINGQHIGGYTDLAALERAGTLENYFNRNSAVK